jgi:formamidopyrimidine-DNA glycosylase
MPELPDVEIAKRRLHDALAGATIVEAHSADRYVLRPQSPRVLSRALVGRKVQDVSRRGKWLRILLEDGGRLFSHLGMTGWWIEREADAPGERSERARIDARRDDGRTTSIRYLDSRRFGRLVVANEDISEWSSLGPDPLVDGLQVPYLAVSLAQSRRSIKEVVMDQSVVAGIGNILATEALWHARIDPRSKSDSLSRSDVGRLARGLAKAIRQELTTRESAGTDDWQDVFSVYGKKVGTPCPRCASPLARVVLGGRTTVFCKHCQRRTS